MSESQGRSDRYGLAPSPRQVEILHLLAKGYTLEAIAKRMHIALSTAKTQSQTLYRRLGANNAAQAVTIAFQLGILRPNYLREEERFWLYDSKGHKITYTETRKSANEIASLDPSVSEIHQEVRWITPWTTGDVLDVSPPTLTARGGHATGAGATA